MNKIELKEKIRVDAVIQNEIKKIVVVLKKNAIHLNRNIDDFVFAGNGFIFESWGRFFHVKFNPTPVNWDGYSEECYKDWSIDVFKSNNEKHGCVSVGDRDRTFWLNQIFNYFDEDKIIMTDTKAIMMQDAYTDLTQISSLFMTNNQLPVRQFLVEIGGNFVVIKISIIENDKELSMVDLAKKYRTGTNFASLINSIENKIDMKNRKMQEILTKQAELEKQKEEVLHLVN